MQERVPKVRFRTADGDEPYCFWLPRRLIVIHLNRDRDRDRHWIAATYVQRRGRRIERLEGFVSRQDL
ncbi:MAG TPA: hypothetical protein VGX21_23210 [Methylomirabilota bacterium]|nr:hypothetical protein [Methylomirabilota bacterium]